MKGLSSRNESPLLCEESAFRFFVHRSFNNGTLMTLMRRITAG
jgi:hypothetical protein